MTYFDTAYIAKCYLNEPGANEVRALARTTNGLASCELARLEFASVLKRHVREGHLSRREGTATIREFEQDERDGVWHWYPVTEALIESARGQVLALPGQVFVRSGDALHLTCAAEQGFRQVYTSDRHMLRAAKHFKVIGVDILGA